VLPEIAGVAGATEEDRFQPIMILLESIPGDEEVYYSSYRDEVNAGQYYQSFVNLFKKASEVNICKYMYIAVLVLVLQCTRCIVRKVIYIYIFRFF
jgi:hypothetical protein